MSARALSVVWSDFRTGGLAKLAMLALADCAGDDGENVLPSMQVLAEKISCPEREAERVLGDLIAQRHVDVFEDCRGRSYRLNLARLDSKTP